MQTVKTLIRLGGCPGWSESSLGAHATSLVLSWGISYGIVEGGITVTLSIFFIDSIVWPCKTICVAARQNQQNYLCAQWRLRSVWAFAQSDRVLHGKLSQIMRKHLMPFANKKGVDQSVHPHSLISPFVVCCLDSIIPNLAKSKLSRH